ncbi:enoyl-CoA hydratase [Brevundimonas sp. MYb46]|nr:enoyl-CoA hydratase-related protein [Brevundimonas sp. MYb46]PQZ84526.1 enoyl-CoA hydratase [Brevundimonas sp. MYb31]PRA27374.1 enoyl-CoA hydratase [Brevundimonas sp. MYb27]PRB17761.1 enoyl-CoA hydratase [Brevundimonas sp. MYb52]PRB56086.1 enoyl-CoA hydratase [Brevundimonas sp. MYb33]PRB38132.1 enoyl-CoA hydratase [Brevundimonas sp. MYb46]
MLKIELDDGLLWIRLNRPDQLNAFDEAMGDDLEAAFRAADSDDEVRAVLVTGEGRAFCAGADLTRPGNVFALDETARPDLALLQTKFEDPYVVGSIRDKGGRVALAIDECRKPVVAAINGVAVGVGATMILAMDFRLASTEARFGYVFSRLGVVPEACSTWFLPRIVGHQRALEWCLTGEVFGADAALQAGLVRSVHAPDELLAAAEAFARSLFAGRSPAAVALTRQMLRRNADGGGPREAHLIESLAMFEMSLTDGREGVAAFLEKRTPRFSHKASDIPASLGGLFQPTRLPTG